MDALAVRMQQAMADVCSCVGHADSARDKLAKSQLDFYDSTLPADSFVCDGMLFCLMVSADVWTACY